MAHSIEARVPFLDYRLVGLAYSLDGPMIDPRQHDEGRAPAGTRRAPSAEGAERRDKIGFATPEARWMREELGAMAGDVFASRTFAERGWFDPVGVRRKLERHRAGTADEGFELFRALSVELWAQRFIDRWQHRIRPVLRGGGPLGSPL